VLVNFYSLRGDFYYNIKSFTLSLVVKSSKKSFRFPFLRDLLEILLNIEKPKEPLLFFIVEIIGFDKTCIRCVL
jgi:hypothetical protein